MAKALITSGGGAKGAFTIGALIAMNKRGMLPFDVISGTSTGSLIAALVAAGELDSLREQYLEVGNNDILAKQNIIANVLNKKAFLFDTFPLLGLIKKHITVDVFNKIMSPAAPTLCITAVSLQTGLPTVFSNRDLMPPHDKKYFVRKFESREMMIDALLASGSQAGFTPPVKMGTDQFVDGGHRDVIPSRIVVDLGIEDVYILSNNPSVQFEVKKDYNDLIGVVLRIISIFVQDVRENDVKLLNDFLEPRGKKAVVIEPSADLDEDNATGLRFDSLLMAAWMIHGEARANTILDNLVGVGPPVIV